MSIRPVNTGNINLQDIKLKILAYGSPGSGKTHLASTMPKPFFIAVDQNGLKVLKVRGLSIDAVKVDTYHDILTVIDGIGKMYAKNAQSIVLDHLTDITPMIINEVLIRTGKERMDLNTWGIASDYVRVMLSNLLRLGNKYHICVLSHEEVKEDKMRGDTFGVPLTIGKLSFHIGGMFDMYLHAVQETKFSNGKQVPAWHVETVKTGRFIAKDLFRKLDVVEPNDFKVIHKKIMEGINARD
jgi:hypothetical protein